MKRYRGIRTSDGCKVTVLEEGKPERELPLRLDLMDASPDGFEWGYPGSGPAQLAVAILADLYGDEAALKHYFDLKLMVTSILPRDDFVLSEHRIHDCIYGTGLGIATDEA